MPKYLVGFLLFVSIQAGADACRWIHVSKGYQVLAPGEMPEAIAPSAADKKSPIGEVFDDR